MEITSVETVGPILYVIVSGATSIEAAETFAREAYFTLTVTEVADFGNDDFGVAFLAE